MTRPKKLGSGLVLLVAHLEPALRERVRAEALAQDRPLSDVVTDALCAGLFVIETNRERRQARARKGAGCHG